jgi:hypothetical protein
MTESEKSTLRVLLRNAEASGLWFWLGLHGFTKTYPPNDVELAGLVRVADAESANWNIRSYLRATLRIAA